MPAASLFVLFPIAMIAISMLAFMLFAAPLTWIAIADPPGLRRRRIQGRLNKQSSMLWPSVGSWLVNNAAMFAGESLGLRISAPPLVSSRTYGHDLRQRWFRRGQRMRTGSEGRISVLKRRDGLTRSRYHGMRGIRRWVGWGVVSNNLWVLITRPQNQKQT